VRLDDGKSKMACTDTILRTYTIAGNIWRLILRFEYPEGRLVGMRAKQLTIILSSILLLSPCASLKAKEPDKSVNLFYTKLVQTLGNENASARAVAKLVGENRHVAKKCLAIIKQKHQSAPPDQKAAFGLLQEKLSNGLLLSTPGANCSRDIIGSLEKRLTGQILAEDKTFFIETIVRLCPEEGAHYYPQLGDLYFNQAQFGMAANAYEKALATKDDPGVRQALREAQRNLASYQEAKPLSKEDFARLSEERQMGVQKKWVRKIQPPNSIQTNRILFDEWSYAIKQKSLPELREFGQALESELSRRPALTVSIEGHTDNRGAYEKNMVLSRQRAEAIKKYLVASFKIDPTRLSTKGYGPDKPFSPRNDAEGWAENRRVEFKLSE
jgi:outer membrane protein OmpA-like peptidoglycan-associated protein